MWSINIPTFVKDVFPQKERTTEKIRFMSAALTLFQRIWDVFNSFIYGADTWSGAGGWSAGTYALGEQVFYIPTGEVYECKVSSTTGEPSKSSDWTKVLNMFIGDKEVKFFNGNLINLEFALNRYFQFAWNDPPALNTIYITKNIKPIQSFYVGLEDDTSSTIDSITSSGLVPLNNVSAVTFNSFTINVPASLYIDLGAQAEKIVRLFVDKYNTKSLFYNIITY